MKYGHNPLSFFNYHSLSSDALFTNTVFSLGAQYPVYPSWKMNRGHVCESVLGHYIPNTHFNFSSGLRKYAYAAKTSQPDLEASTSRSPKYRPLTASVIIFSLLAGYFIPSWINRRSSSGLLFNKDHVSAVDSWKMMGCLQVSMSWSFAALWLRFWALQIFAIVVISSTNSHVLIAPMGILRALLHSSAPLAIACLCQRALATASLGPNTAMRLSKPNSLHVFTACWYRPGITVLRLDLSVLSSYSILGVFKGTTYAGKIQLSCPYKRLPGSPSCRAQWQ